MSFHYPFARDLIHPSKHTDNIIHTDNYRSYDIPNNESL